MNKQHQLLCAWSGLVAILCFGIGFGAVAGFIPPPSPHMTAPEVAAIYQTNTIRIRVGMVILVIGAGLFIPWASVISTQLRRIEDYSKVLTNTQLLSGLLGAVLFLLPALMWITLAFRPDRNPDSMLLLHDLAWLMFLVPVSQPVVQNFAIAFTILSDDGEPPVFPRWLAYVNLFTAVLFTPGALIPFFKFGPFAWNGLFGFWIPGVFFCTWVVVMFFALRKAIREQLD